MGVPRVPLSEMYGQVAIAIERAGGKVHLRSTVDMLCHDVASRQWRVGVGERTGTSTLSCSRSHLKEWKSCSRRCRGGAA